MGTARGMDFFPHVREAVGPNGVWYVLRFDPPRIGHGFRFVENSALPQFPQEKNIAFELGVTSNFYRENISQMEEHPLRGLRNSRVAITLNSSDAQMLNTTIVDEYHIAASRFSSTGEELAQISLNAVRFALLDGVERLTLECEFTAVFRNLGVESTRTRKKYDRKGPGRRGEQNDEPSA